MLSRGSASPKNELVTTARSLLAVDGFARGDAYSTYTRSLFFLASEINFCEKETVVSGYASARISTPVLWGALRIACSGDIYRRMCTSADERLRYRSLFEEQLSTMGASRRANARGAAMDAANWRRDVSSGSKDLFMGWRM